MFCFFQPDINADVNTEEGVKLYRSLLDRLLGINTLNDRRSGFGRMVSQNSKNFSPNEKLKQALCRGMNSEMSSYVVHCVDFLHANFSAKILLSSCIHDDILSMVLLKYPTGTYNPLGDPRVWVVILLSSKPCVARVFCRWLFSLLSLQCNFETSTSSRRLKQEDDCFGV